MKQIKNIIFDMGGVLLDLDMPGVYEAFKKIDCPEIGQLIDPYIQSGAFLKLEKGEITPEELHSEIRRTICPNITGEQIDEALYGIVEGIASYKLDMLLDLRRKGYKTYMLSNTNAIIMPYVEEKYFKSQGLTVHDYFDKLFLSYELKAVKPHREIFEKMIAAGVEPQESLFIDDGEQNILTARSMGFHVYLAKNKEDYRHIFAEY